MGILDGLQTQQVSLPVVGSISLVAALVGGAVLFFALRRKKSLSLKI